MSFVNLSTVIMEIPKKVSFHDYLTYMNYKLLKDKNFNGFECYKKQSDQFDDIVYVGKIKEEENYYSVHYNDQGNIIDFVKNRIEIEDHYQEFTPEKDHLIEACKFLIIFLNERGESKMNTSVKTSQNDFKALIEKSFTKHYNAVDLFDFKYLDSLKIIASGLENCYVNGSPNKGIAEKINPNRKLKHGMQQTQPFKGKGFDYLKFEINSYIGNPK